MPSPSPKPPPNPAPRIPPKTAAAAAPTPSAAPAAPKAAPAKPAAPAKAAAPAAPPKAEGATATPGTGLATRPPLSAGLAVAADAPDHVKQAMARRQGGPAGFESMRASDVIHPRLRILQPTSKEVVQLGLPVGGIMDSVKKEAVCGRDEMVEFMIAFWFLSWVEWGDREIGEGILGQSTDPRSVLAQEAARFVKKTVTAKGGGTQEVFKVTEYFNFVVMLRERPGELLMLPCYRTGHKHGKYLLNLARGRRCDVFMGAYTVSTTYKEEGDRQWFEWEFAQAGFGTPEEIAWLEQQHNDLKELHQQHRIAIVAEDDIERAAEAETVGDADASTDGGEKL